MDAFNGQLVTPDSLSIVSSNSGFIINYDSLSRRLGRSKQTIINYIFYLEYSLILGILKNMRPGSLSSFRKMKRVSFSRSPFLFSLNRGIYPDMGLIFEKLLFQALGADMYYREGKEEIGFMLSHQGNMTAIEVKSGNFNIKKFSTLLDKLDLTSGIIISDNEFGIHE